MLVRSCPMVCTGRISISGESSGTSSIVRPRVPVDPGAERVSRKQKSARCANVVKIFCPLTIQSSPSRSERVAQAKTSDPPAGSVYPRQIRVSPAVTPGRILPFSSSEPVALIAFAGSIVVPGPMVGTPPLRRVSNSTAASNGSRPAPPSSTGHVGATHPRSPSLRVSALSTPSPVRRSFAITARVTCRAMNSSASPRMGAQFAGSVKSIRSVTSRESGTEPSVREDEKLASGVGERHGPSLGPPVIKLDVVLLGEAVSAMDVEAVLARLIGRFGGEHKGHRGKCRPVLLIGVECPTRLMDQQSGTVQGAQDVRERMRNSLIHADRLPERVPGFGVFGTDVHGLLSQTDQGGGPQHTDLVKGRRDLGPRLPAFGERTAAGVAVPPS